MRDNNHLPFSVRSLLWRHKIKVFVVFSLVSAATIAAVIYWPRTYYSEARLFVRVGRESVTLDPTTTVGETIQLSASRESEITTVRDMLKSRAMIEKVVDELGKDCLQGPKGERNRLQDWISAALQPIRQLDPLSERDAAVEALITQVDISSDRKSNLIELRCTAKTPELAQKVVAKLVDVYLEEHARLNRTPGCYAFFAAQATVARDRLAKAADELRKAKNEVGLLSIDGQRHVVESHLSTLSTELLKVQAAQSAAEAKAETLRKSLASVPERMMTDEVQGYPNAAADEMRRLLFELEIHEAELSSKFAADYPLLVAIRRQIKEARQVHDKQEPRRTQYTTTVNAVHQQVLASLLGEEANDRSLRAELASLQQQHTLARRQLQSLNDQEARIALLQRDVDLLEDSSRTYAHKLEQSRIDDALRAERITNVNLVQPAALIHKPVSPKKPVVLAAGLCLALFSAVGLALLADSSSERKQKQTKGKRGRGPTPGRYVVSAPQAFGNQSRPAEVAAIM